MPRGHVPRQLNPNEAEARALVASVIDRLYELGYVTVVVVTDLENEYHWTSTQIPKDVVVDLVRSEANGLERDVAFGEEIKVVRS
jgi:hypothetical protein